MKTILALLVACLAIFPSFAATDSTANKSLLWRIGGQGLKKPSYLFGTIHLICPDDFLWTPAMAGALKSADKVCFEIDLDDPKVLQEVMAAFSDTTTRTKRKPLDKAEMEHVAKVMQDSLGIDSATVMDANPLTLQQLGLMKLLRCSQPASYEQHILLDAMKNGQEVLGLETTAEQLRVLNTMQSDNTGKDLLEIVNKLPQIRRTYAGLVTTYVAQDLPALSDYFLRLPEFAGHLDELIYDRNKRWIGRMKPVMAQASVFYAVGAGHLWGTQGVIQLLRAAGYSVSPVR